MDFSTVDLIKGPAYLCESHYSNITDFHGWVEEEFSDEPRSKGEVLEILDRKVEEFKELEEGEIGQGKLGKSSWPESWRI